MKKNISIFIAALFILSVSCSAQDLKTSAVPAAAKSACAAKFFTASKVSWEKEDGNYEANWGGKSGEDSSAQFTAEGKFVEIIVAIPVKNLPQPVFDYVKNNYSNKTINEAGRVTDADGKTSYEAEIKGKDLLFDENGKFIKAD